MELVDLIVLPLLRRIGSLVAGAAAAWGATADQSVTIEASLVALLGIAIDLALSRRDKKKQQQKTHAL